MSIDHKVCIIPSGLHRFYEPFEYVPPARYQTALRTLNETAERERLKLENEALKEQGKD